MGFVKDLRDLSRLGKEAGTEWDPAAQIRAATDRMQRIAAHAHLVRSGVPAPATVVALRDTGTSVNHLPVVEVDVTVLPAGGIPFAAVTSVIGHVPLAGLAVGSTVRVRYDPDDPSSVAIE